ncbi:MAG: hypothetical protein ACFFAO_07045 [Candidatus Hermodarchaeota archaeon]
MVQKFADCSTSAPHFGHVRTTFVWASNLAFFSSVFCFLATDAISWYLNNK